MTINLNVPEGGGQPDLRPKITVVGVGGAGGNAVNNMIESSLEGVEFVVANTDAQSLEQSKSERRVQLGAAVTGGLGAGARPDVGRSAAEESMEDLIAEIHGSNMVFIAAGMGGGTGTGAAPVVARAAREQGILTVGVVTKPFQFEGAHRARTADEGIKELEQYVDTLIIIPNQNLFRVANEKTTFADAFKMADDVLYSGVRGVTDLMVMPGLINLDFADIRSVMSEMGKAMMGTGEAEGERRALEAAEAAISNPLLDDTSMKGARGVLINITGGSDMTLFEVDEAANRIRSEVDNDAYIIFGSTFDAELDGQMRVSVVATGMDGQAAVRPEPRVLDILQAVAGADVKPEPVPVPESAATAGVAEADIPQPPETQLDSVASAENGPGADDNEDVIEAASETVAGDAVLEPEQPEIDLGAVPPATPSIDADDAFIPSAPVARATEVPMAEADAFQEAEMANGSGEVAMDQAQAKAEAEHKARFRALSLFEKVTGAARGARMEKADMPAAPATVSTFKKPAPAPAKTEAAPLLQAEAAERPSVQSSPVDDDMLDIPAFLRRQAN